MIDLNTIWYGLYVILITGYAILDGFDLGVGALHIFARSNHERRIHLNAIGPVWDGNEVWLITAGGALFAAFPIVYATVFSAFYMALILLLIGLIFRAVAIEFRSKVENPGWQKFWDYSFWLGSLLPAILFGVAVGNILRGIPIDSRSLFTGSFWGLLNPYAILIGLLSLTMFTMQGAAYLANKSEGELQSRMHAWVQRSWFVYIVLYITATLATIFSASYLFEGVLRSPLSWLFFLLLLAAILYIPISLKSGQYRRTFLATSVTILAMIALAAIAMFPRLVPSSIDPAYSLTIYNAASTSRTLTVMLIIALIGMPLVIAYTIYIYRTFKGKTVLTEESY